MHAELERRKRAFPYGRIDDLVEDTGIAESKQLITTIIDKKATVRKAKILLTIVMVLERTIRSAEKFK